MPKTKLGKWPVGLILLFYRNNYWFFGTFLSPEKFFLLTKKPKVQNQYLNWVFLCLFTSIYLSVKL